MCRSDLMGTPGYKGKAEVPRGMPSPQVVSSIWDRSLGAQGDAARRDEGYTVYIVKLGLHCRSGQPKSFPNHRRPAEIRFDNSCSAPFHHIDTDLIIFSRVVSKSDLAYEALSLTPIFAIVYRFQFPPAIVASFGNTLAYSVSGMLGNILPRSKQCRDWGSG